MISKINLENFKSFKQIKDLKIKPITVFCGTNSCGKSSILKSILLWKQTLESRNAHQTILLNGRLMHLGNFNNLVHKRKEDGSVVLDFEYNFKASDISNSSYMKRGLPVSLLLRDFFTTSRERSRISDCRYVMKHKVELKQSHSTPHGVNIESCNFAFYLYDENNELKETGTQMTLTRQKNDRYHAKWENIRARYRPDELKEDNGEISDLKINFANLFPIDISAFRENNEPSYAANHLAFYFYRLSDLLRTIYNDYSYIGPLREEPARRYIYEDEVLEIGTKGENAAYLFLSEQNKEIKNHFFYNPSFDSFEQEPRIKLKDAVSNCLSKMGINNFLPEQNSDIIHLMLNASSHDTTRVNIADVGFGVSQIFPIVLEGLRLNHSNTLLLEQPEIHLHPNLQMQLADYLISLALSEKRVIIETHSDHIVNRLVRRIVEDEKFNFKDMITIYFVESGSDGSQINEVEIDENIGIKNWPKDFFDQTASEQQKIIKAGVKKRIMKRQGAY